MSVGVYIHIPFCKAKCLYCDFNSYAGLEKWYLVYTNALCEEILMQKNDCKVDSLYIGGGTPTVFPPELLIRILTHVKENFLLTSDCEITIECNPATMDGRGFQKLVNAGFNRLSIGLQSTKEEELQRLGRIHTLGDFADCFSDARRAGFQNISLDLMYGLPGQEISGWMDTLKAAVSFQPEHISCYGLKLEEGTPLFAQKPELPDDDMVRECYDICIDYLASQGYQQYEISNFSRLGKESRHNCKYWKCEDFLGFGAGAYSCFQDVRCDNLRSVSEYCKSMQEDKNVTLNKIPLTLQDKMSEYCFLGLRMNCGISISEFYHRFQKDIMEVYGDAIKKNLRRGTLLRLGDRLCIPKDWLYVSNSILIDFI